MNNHMELFEFLCQLIDIQIKKYKALVGFGVGPDARMNAQLVFNEVNELFSFAEKLLEITSEDEQDFKLICSQIKFYIEQEYLRGYAGWLLDENNIHTPEIKRVHSQLAQINALGTRAQIDCSISSKPQTLIQKQCEYDSYEIASFILNLAKNIKLDPDMELDSQLIPAHARQVLKRNAITRYREPHIAKEIDRLYGQCSNFLKQSELTKSTDLLDQDTSISYVELHKKHLEELLERYKIIAPTSNLFNPQHQWYKIGRSHPEPVKIASFTPSKTTWLFGGIAAGAILTYMLLPYFAHAHSEPSVFKRP